MKMRSLGRLAVCLGILGASGAAAGGLAGCLEGEAGITVNAGGSGRVSLEYTVPRVLAGVGRVGEDRNLIPLPVREEDFEEAAAGYDGIRFEEVTVEADPEEIRASAELVFDSADDLSRFWYRSQTSWQFNPEGGSLRVLLYQPFEQGIDEQSLERLRAFRDGYAWTVELTVPGEITSLSRGETAGIDRGITMVDVLQAVENNDEIWWDIAWR